MYSVKRPFKRLMVIIILGLMAVVVSACTGQVGNTNWPGLSTNGETVYVAYGDGVVAYDVTNQEQVWLFPEERSTAPIYAAPAIENDRIAIGDFGAPGGFFTPGSVVTLYLLQDDNNMPQELWNTNLNNTSIIAPPLQVDDLILIGTTDNFIVAYSADEAGTELWRFETGHSIWGQPAYQDGVVFAASLDKTVYALDADDGSLIWQSEPLAGALASQPVVGNGLVYLASFDGKVHALLAATGEEAWAFTAEDWIWASPALVDDALYFADQKGNLYAVTAIDGELIWTQQFDQAFQTTPVIVEDMLYMASAGDISVDVRSREEGALIALDVSNGQEIWRKRTPAPIYTTPVVADNSVVVAIQSEEELLIGFDPQTGNRQWDFQTPER